MKANFSYGDALHPDTIPQLQDSKYSISTPLQNLIISPSAISPNDTEWLHCVDATKTKTLIKLRVITKYNQGMNILIPIYITNPEIKEKFEDIRFKVRNCDRVEITVPRIYVQCSAAWKSQLYLLADDFTIREIVR